MGGDQDEILFHYAPTRQHHHVETFLNGFKGTLLSDGYAAYEERATARADNQGNGDYQDGFGSQHLLG